jgi:hypothetical protein
MLVFSLKAFTVVTFVDAILMLKAISVHFMPIFLLMLKANFLVVYAKLIVNAQRKVVGIFVLVFLILIANMASVLPLSLKQKTHSRWPLAINSRMTS